MSEIQTETVCQICMIAATEKCQDDLIADLFAIRSGYTLPAHECEYPLQCDCACH